MVSKLISDKLPKYAHSLQTCSIYQTKYPYKANVHE